jgi:hypothetical protein
MGFSPGPLVRSTEADFSQPAGTEPRGAQPTEKRHVTAVPCRCMMRSSDATDERYTGKPTLGRGGQTYTMQSLDLQGFTYEQRQGLLPLLATAFGDCGGWVLERKTLSPTNMEFRIEIQLRAILDLYAAIVATGVELTRSGHISLTELCTRRNHLWIAAELGQIVEIRFEISFLDDLTLHSLLASGSGLA